MWFQVRLRVAFSQCLGVTRFWCWSLRSSCAGFTVHGGACLTCKGVVGLTAMSSTGLVGWFALVVGLRYAPIVALVGNNDRRVSVRTSSRGEAPGLVTRSFVVSDMLLSVRRSNMCSTCGDVIRVTSTKLEDGFWLVAHECQCDGLRDVFVARKGRTGQEIDWVMARWLNAPR